MNHHQYREWLNLLVYDELEAQDKDTLHKHLEQCAECRKELHELRKLGRLMTDVGETPSDTLLQQARADLRASLRREEYQSYPVREQNAGARVLRFVPSWKTVLAYAAVLALGLLGGALLFSRGDAPIIVQETVPETGIVGPATGGETEIANVRFIDQDSGDGSVEFAFDAIRPVRIKGNVNDPKIQEVLTYAMVKEQNAGVRLRAVSTISANHTKPDNKVKQALLTALCSDANDGVRREALAVLQKYPFDEEIQGTLLYVLQNDPNPAMRIEAIKSLEAKNIEGKELIQVLRDRMESDNNSYIRQKAKAVLEEVEVQ